MSAAATEVILLPGFDGVANLRREFIAALSERFPTRGLTYPAQALGSLEGYWKFAAGEIAPDSRPIVIGESFGGLVAARLAANDPRVAGVVLCGAFARNPVSFVTHLGASIPSLAKFVGSKLFVPALLLRSEGRRYDWARTLPAAMGALHHDVMSERLRVIANETTASDLSSLRMPVVLVQFDGDLVILPRERRYLESVCHNPRIVRQPGPHYALETRPQECAQAIAECLEALFQ